MATARAVNDFIEVTMNTLDSWHSPPGHLIRLRMSVEVARCLRTVSVRPSLRQTPEGIENSDDRAPNVRPDRGRQFSAAYPSCSAALRTVRCELKLPFQELG